MLQKLFEILRDAKSGPCVSVAFTFSIVPHPMTDNFPNQNKKLLKSICLAKGFTLNYFANFNLKDCKTNFILWRLLEKSGNFISRNGNDNGNEKCRRRKLFREKLFWHFRVMIMTRVIIIMEKSFTERSLLLLLLLLLCTRQMLYLLWYRILQKNGDLKCSVHGSFESKFRSAGFELTSMG